jgi:hypothetical protein
MTTIDLTNLDGLPWLDVCSQTAKQGASGAITEAINVAANCSDEATLSRQIRRAFHNAARTSKKAYHLSNSEELFCDGLLAGIRIGREIQRKVSRSTADTATGSPYGNMDKPELLAECKVRGLIAPTHWSCRALEYWLEENDRRKTTETNR